APTGFCHDDRVPTSPPARPSRRGSRLPVAPPRAGRGRPPAKASAQPGTNTRRARANLSREASSLSNGDSAHAHSFGEINPNCTSFRLANFRVIDRINVKVGTFENK